MKWTLDLQSRDFQEGFTYSNVFMEDIRESTFGENIEGNDFQLYHEDYMNLAIF